MPSFDALSREGLVGTYAIPPLPHCLLSASGTTSLVLGTMLARVPRLSRRQLEPFIATGRRALTWSLPHMAVPMSLYAKGANQQLSPVSAMLVGVALFAGAVAWSQRDRDRPDFFEQLMCKAAGITPQRLAVKSRVPATFTTR
jgi:hypothetical protein